MLISHVYSNRQERIFIVSIDLFILGFFCFFSIVVTYIMSFFRNGIGDQTVLSPLTFFVLRYSWVVHIPVILTLFLTIVNLFGKVLGRFLWSFVFLLIILTFVVIVLIWIWGMSWPCWKLK